MDIISHNDRRKRGSKASSRKFVVEKEKITIMENRYPKLIYAFRKFFSILGKIHQSKNQFDHILYNDIFAVKEKHNLGEYESILREVLHE